MGFKVSMSYRTKKYKKRVITQEQVFDSQKLQPVSEELTEESMLAYSKHNKNSYPYSMTETKLSKFFEAINYGASYDTACKYAEMSPGTLYHWLNKAKEDTLAKIPNSPYVSFQNKLNKAEAEYEVNLLKNINEMIKERDPFISHLLKYLSIKFPKKWSTNI